MLAVARSAACTEGVAITWHEGIAESLPFPDASFDHVLMQQVLQYVQDPIVALSEMGRVLIAGGRVVSSTWSAIEQNPVHHILARAVERHLGTAAMQTQFALGGPAVLGHLFADAGFEEITITVATRTDDLPLPDRFVGFAIAGAVAAMPALQDMDAQARERLVAAIHDEVTIPLKRYTKDAFIITPMEAHIVLARKPD